MSGEPFMTKNAEDENPAINRVTELEIANQALRKQVEQFREFVEGTDYLIFRADGNGRLVYVNPAVEHVVGISPEDCVGRSLFDFTVPNDRDCLETLWGDCIRKASRTIECEDRLIHDSGAVRDVFWNINFHYGKKGGLDYVNGTIRDITESKSEERLVEAQTRLIGFAATHTVKEFLQRFLDEAEKLTDSAIGFYHFLEPDQETLVLQTWSTNTLQNMCAAEGAGLHYSISEAGVWVDCVRERKPVVHNDYANLPHKKGLPEGHAPVVRELVVPVLRDEKIVAILGVGNKSTSYDDRDVKTVQQLADVAWETVVRRLAQEELIESEKRYRNLFDDALDMIHIVDAGGILIDANRSELKTLGYTKEEYLGKPLLEVVHPNHSDITEENLKRALAGEEIRNYETVLLTKDGKEIPVEVCAVPRNREGSDSTVRAIVRDISERKRAEEKHRELESQLNQSQKMEAVGRLAGGVAHDFNNLLTVILANADLMKPVLKENETCLQNLQMIREAVEQATGVTRSLLTFSRNVSSEKRRIDLCDSVERSASLLKRMLSAAIELKVNVEQAYPVWVNADATQMQQVVINLAINARDAMPQGGELSISVKRRSIFESETKLNNIGDEGLFAELVVKDTGGGISEENLPHIFEPFFTTKPREHGTGLGLSIIHGIVEEHGGRVDVQSDVGKGAAFSVFLPCVPGRKAKDAELKPDLDQLRGNGELILLVEDHCTIQRLATRALEAVGYQVMIASDGKEAMKLYQENREKIELFVLDVDLPKKSGLQCLEDIRRDGVDVPAIVVTGRPEAELEENLDKHSVLLRKPFRMTALTNLACMTLKG